MLLGDNKYQLSILVVLKFGSTFTLCPTHAYSNHEKIFGDQGKIRKVSSAGQCS